MNLDQLVDAELAEASSKSLRADGPLIDVELYFRCGDGLCRSVRGKALVDTGADRTAVEFTEADAAGAKPEGSYHAQGVTSEAITLPVYSLKMRFPGTDLPEVNIESAAATPHLKSQGIVALIGRDVLEQVHLGYNGPTGQFSLSAPRGALEVKASPVSYGVLIGGGVLAGVMAYLLLREPECPPCKVTVKE